jgi:hypothetical protein
LANARARLAGGNVCQAFEAALAVAKLAGKDVPAVHLPADEQLSLALQAADEVIEALAVELAGRDQDDNTHGKE